MGKILGTDNTDVGGFVEAAVRAANARGFSVDTANPNLGTGIGKGQQGNYRPDPTGADARDPNEWN